jgi:hypothetical protein
VKPGARSNPYQRTAAQLEQRDAMKRVMWDRSRQTRLSRLPLPDDAEAAALVAAYLARGGVVTVCAPCAAPDGPNNNGVPWRMGSGLAQGDGRVLARRYSK